jgi:NADPH2:quinone reductase
MGRTVIIEEFGGPENMKLVEREAGTPGPGEVRIRHKAVGLNYIDVYQRTGLYPLDLPHALGMEGAGIIEAVGDGVTHLKEGDRAAYASQPPGAYCDTRVMPASAVCPLPDAVSFEEGAAIMLQGLTVEYLFHRVWPMEKGDAVLFHAAAGGVGLLACQWARSEGIRLIGTAGTDEKCQMALDHGAEVCINYRDKDFVPEVKAATDGEGVGLVMDGVGKDTFDGSLDCLKPLGMMISFGNASGPVPPVSMLTLAQKGSIKITRTTLFTFLSDHARAQAMAQHLFGKVASGDIKVNIGQTFPIENIVEAHKALEARETIGSTVITL